MKPSDHLRECRSSWRSLQPEIEADIRLKRYEQLYHRLEVIISEVVTIGVPRRVIINFIAEKMQKRGVKFTPRETKHGKSA